jgi:hypothetical protein
MNITAFRYLSGPSKFLPALIALELNAILFWGAVRATSVLPPERVSRMSAAAVDGNENWEFGEDGLMHRRYACINDMPIKESERKFHWPLGRRRGWW